MVKLILIIPADLTLWRDVTNESKSPHVKSGCDIGDGVTQIFICLFVYMLTWWAAAAVKCKVGGH